MVKDGLLYTKDHEWVKIDGNEATIGISDYAQDYLGEVTYVELPEIGRQLDAHGEIAVVESSKAASDVYCPLAGKVTAVNDTLEDQPELVNQDCYGQGWIAKIEITDDSAKADLMDAKQYEQYISEL